MMTFKDFNGLPYICRYLHSGMVSVIVTPSAIVDCGFESRPGCQVLVFCGYIGFFIFMPYLLCYGPVPRTDGPSLPVLAKDI
jgi:hypothetical protein